MARKKRRKTRTSVNVPPYHFASVSKTKFVMKNVILFGLMSIIFYLLSSIDTNELFVNFFYLLFILAGVIGFAFFIVLLILIVSKWIKK